MAQSFFRNGRWVSHGDLLKVIAEDKEVHPDPIKPKTELEKNMAAELETLSIEELRELYKGLYKKDVPNNCTNSPVWIINKIKLYEQHDNLDTK